MRKKSMNFSLFFVVLLGVFILCFSVKGAEASWYEGGTLQRATIGEWKQATSENKLATCADFIATWSQGGVLKNAITDMDDFKYRSKELVICINTSVEGIDAVNSNKVNKIAALSAIAMGWTK